MTGLKFQIANFLVFFAIICSYAKEAKKSEEPKQEGTDQTVKSDNTEQEDKIENVEQEPKIENTAAPEEEEEEEDAYQVHTFIPILSRKN